MKTYINILIIIAVISSCSSKIHERSNPNLKLVSQDINRIGLLEINEMNVLNENDSIAKMNLKFILSNDYVKDRINFLDEVSKKTNSLDSFQLLEKFVFTDNKIMYYAYYYDLSNHNNFFIKDDKVSHYKGSIDLYSHFKSALNSKWFANNAIVFTSFNKKTVEVEIRLNIAIQIMNMNKNK